MESKEKMMDAIKDLLVLCEHNSIPCYFDGVEDDCHICKTNEAIRRAYVIGRSTRVEPTGQELVRIDELKELLENSEFFKAFVPTVSINDGEESYQYWAETINELLESVMAKFGQPRQELEEITISDIQRKCSLGYGGAFKVKKYIESKFGQPKTEVVPEPDELMFRERKLDESKTEGGEK